MPVHTNSKWHIDSGAEFNTHPPGDTPIPGGIPACPHCQFTKGGNGRPALKQDGAYRCADCGSTWRDIGGTNRPAAGTGQTAQSHRQANTIDQEIAASNTRADHDPGPRRLLNLGVATVLAAIAGFATVGVLLPSGPNLPPATELALSVTSASQFSRDGRIAVRVEGRIENRTALPVPVRTIEIVLAQDKGHRFYRWEYTPALRQLQPGSSLRFATADGNVPQPASSVEIGVGNMTAAMPL